MSAPNVETPSGSLAEPRRGLELTMLPMASLRVCDGVVVEANEAFARMVGPSMQELLGRPADHVIQQLVLPPIPEAVQRLSEDRDAERAGKGVLQPPQGLLWMRLRDADGQPREVKAEWCLSSDRRESYWFFTDIASEAFAQKLTEQLARAAAVLASSQDELEVQERALDALNGIGYGAAILWFDSSGQGLRLGPTRVSREKPGPEDPRWREVILPTSMFLRVNPHLGERRAVFVPDVDRFIRELAPGPMGDELIRTMPSPRCVLAPLFVGGEAFGVVVATGSTLTPLVATSIELFSELVGHAIANVRLRQEHLQHERLQGLGEAAAVMAHEVRNPVAAITNAVALFRRAPGAPQTAELVRIIGEEAGRLERLVAQLLELCRPLEPVPQEARLDDLVASSLELLSARGEVDATRIDVIPWSGLRTHRLDPELAQLAIGNVLVNALQSRPPPARVRVSFDQGDDGGAVIIEDQGPGFSPDVVRRLGQPFNTTRATGTGIGLAVVRRVMEATMGRLEVDNNAGGGARVRLWFPTDGERPEAQGATR